MLFPKPNFTLFILLLSPLLILPSVLPTATETGIQNEHDGASFDYKDGGDRGPSRWGQMNPAWKACSYGKSQSPIDLIAGKRAQVVYDPWILRVNYEQANATIENKVHCIALEWEGSAGFLNINGTNYHLNQSHWHIPSEHTLNGLRFDMEMHMVHHSKDKIAVVGIMYRFGPPDPFLALMIPNIQSLGGEGAPVGIVNPNDVQVSNRLYFEYVGSLTTPPCSEGVKWILQTPPRTVSREQVEALRDAVTDGFKSNARPLQPREGRDIFFYL